MKKLLQLGAMAHAAMLMTPATTNNRDERGQPFLVSPSRARLNYQGTTTTRFNRKAQRRTRAHFVKGNRQVINHRP